MTVHREPNTPSLAIAIGLLLAGATGCLVDVDGTRCSSDLDCLPFGQRCDATTGRCRPSSDLICQDECAPLGATRCRDDWIQVCAPAEDGCDAWIDQRDCADRFQTCRQGACVAAGFGGKIAMVSDRSGSFEVWLANDDGTELRRVSFEAPGQQQHLGAQRPRFDPEGQRLAYYYGVHASTDTDLPDSRLLEYDLAAGAQREIRDDDVLYIGQMAWAADGARILTVVHRVCDDYVQQVAVETGASQPVFEDADGDHLSPRCLDTHPEDPEMVVYAAYNCGGDDGGLRLRQLDSDQVDSLPSGEAHIYSLRWSPEGDQLAWTDQYSTAIHTLGLGPPDAQPEAIAVDLPEQEDRVAEVDWADGGLVFTTAAQTGNRVWTCGPDGRRPRLLFEAPFFYKELDWAPGRLPAWAEQSCVAAGGLWAGDGRDGQACWFVAELEQSCTGACADRGLDCDPGDWNDLATSAICTQLTGEPRSTANNPSYGAHAPYLYVPGGSSHGCYYRAAGVGQDCELTTGGGRRLCVCQPFNHP